MSLVEFVIAVHRSLSHCGVAHAFGGALALNHYVDPRGTLDIDVNVFVPVDELDRVIDGLRELDLTPELDAKDWLPAAGVRFRAPEPPYPVDAFPSLDAEYAEVERRSNSLPFGPDRRLLPFLSAEDLTLFKLSFGRPKDWVDIAELAVSLPDLDADYIERQILALRGPSMYPRMARLRSLMP